MKKLILIFIILFTISLSAQSDRRSSSSELIVLFGGVAVDAEAQAYFNALSTPLSGNRQDTIDQFVKRLKDSLSTALLSDYFDRIWILANETEESALQSLVNVSADDAVNVSGTAFAVDRGYTGDGVADYIDTKFNTFTDATVYTQNSASLGFYSRTDANNSNFTTGENDGTHYTAVAPDASGSFFLNLNANATASGDAVANSLGLFSGIRNSSSVMVNWHNDTDLGDFSSTSTGLPNIDMPIGARNNNSVYERFDVRQYAFGFYGKGLTDDEMVKVFRTIEWYLDAIGAGVVTP